MLFQDLVQYWWTHTGRLDLTPFRSRLDNLTDTESLAFVHQFDVAEFQGIHSDTEHYELYQLLAPYLNGPQSARLFIAFLSRGFLEHHPRLDPTTRMILAEILFHTGKFNRYFPESDRKDNQKLYLLTLYPEYFKPMLSGLRELQPNFPKGQYHSGAQTLCRIFDRAQGVLLARKLSPHPWIRQVQEYYWSQPELVTPTEYGALITQSMLRFPELTPNDFLATRESNPHPVPELFQCMMDCILIHFQPRITQPLSNPKFWRKLLQYTDPRFIRYGMALVIALQCDQSEEQLPETIQELQKCLHAQPAVLQYSYWQTMSKMAQVSQYRPNLTQRKLSQTLLQIIEYQYGQIDRDEWPSQVVPPTHPRYMLRLLRHCLKAETWYCEQLRATLQYSVRDLEDEEFYHAMDCHLFDPADQDHWMLTSAAGPIAVRVLKYYFDRKLDALIPKLFRSSDGVVSLELRMMLTSRKYYPRLLSKLRVLPNYQHDLWFRIAFSASAKPLLKDLDCPSTDSRFWMRILPYAPPDWVVQKCTEIHPELELVYCNPHPSPAAMRYWFRLPVEVAHAHFNHFPYELKHLDQIEQPPLEMLPHMLHRRLKIPEDWVRTHWNQIKYSPRIYEVLMQTSLTGGDLLRYVPELPYPERPKKYAPIVGYHPLGVDYRDLIPELYQRFIRLQQGHRLTPNELSALITERRSLPWTTSLILVVVEQLSRTPIVEEVFPAQSWLNHLSRDQLELLLQNHHFKFPEAVVSGLSDELQDLIVVNYSSSIISYECCVCGDSISHPIFLHDLPHAQPRIGRIRLFETLDGTEGCHGHVCGDCLQDWTEAGRSQFLCPNCGLPSSLEIARIMIASVRSDT